MGWIKRIQYPAASEFHAIFTYLTFTPALGPRPRAAKNCGPAVPSPRRRHKRRLASALTLAALFHGPARLQPLGPDERGTNGLGNRKATPPRMAHSARKPRTTTRVGERPTGYPMCLCVSCSLCMGNGGGG
jgi:hypothetical protein